MKLLIRLVIITTILFVPAFKLYSQQSILEIIGTAESNMQPLENAKVTLYKNGNPERSIHTDSKGEFTFELDVNNEYLIEIEKSGFVSKRIAFNTELPNDVTGRWTMEFAMSLFPGCEGVSTSILNEPVDRIKYSTNKADFISDEAYVRNMRGRIDRLMLDIDKCQADKFQDHVEEGNRLMNEGDYAGAAEQFENALAINPNDRSAQRKLEEAENAADETVLNERKYQSTIAQANRYLSENNYEAARAKFSEALSLKPGNELANSKITEIDQVLAAKRQTELQKQQTENKYNSLINQANAAYTSGNYELSKSLYEQALQVKPDALLPQQKIAELNPLIIAQKQQQQQKEANQKAYLEAIAMGESALQSDDLETARQHFTRAQMLKPEESYPRQKIADIDRILDERRTANLEAQKAARQQKIQESLNQGDALLAQNSYEAAEAAYRNALQLDPNDAYARQQINKVKSLQATAAAQKQRTMEKAYSDAVTSGDQLLATASYEQAIQAYKQALLQKPDDMVARNKLSEAERQYAAEQQRLLAEQDKKKQYDQMLARGNSLLGTQQYVEAKQAYQSALNLFPDQPYPRNKIQEIDRLLAQQEKQKQYESFIKSGDGLYAAKNYAAAKSAYQQAITINSSETYARQKIAEIDAIIRESERQATEQEQRNTQYTQAIQEADNLLNSSRLIEARAAYQRALGLKPSEMYPQQQITKIDGLMDERERAENERKINEQYNTAISQADQLFNQNKLEEAKTAYQYALSFKSTETYPKNQILKIDAQLSQLEMQRQEREAFEQKYNSLIASADRAFEQHDYNSAKSVYTEALNMKPSERYPQERLNKIAELERIRAVQEANRNVTPINEANQTSSTAPPKLADLKFANDSERDKYLNGLRSKYPEGVTLEVHKEKTYTTFRYVVIRGDEVREFRKVQFSWGVEYTLNGIPISGQYFDTQVKPREGEFYQKFDY